MPDGVYASRFDSIPAGSKVQVTLKDGSVKTFEVVGSYSFDFNTSYPIPGFGLLLPSDQLTEMTRADTVQYFLDVPQAQLRQVSNQLGRELPDATVVDLVAYSARFTQAYHDLFVLAVAMAGLALLAGMVLIANSVSLAMLDRRYEIGVLKAMGYSNRQILTTLLVEYTLVGVIATVLGLASVQVLLWVLNILQNGLGTLLAITPLSAGWIVLAGVGLTLLAVLLVTWRPTQVSPAVVLNDRE